MTGVFFLGCCPHDALDNLHVIDVEGADGVAAFQAIANIFSGPVSGMGSPPSQMAGRG